jgi:cbb3-type cytochrome oxidase subunit 1
LAIGGVVQGMKLHHGIAFPNATRAMLPFLRVSTTGLLFLLLGNLLFALNIFAMTLKWKFALLKRAVAVVKAPLETEGETGSAFASLRRDKEVKA